MKAGIPDGIVLEQLNIDNPEIVRKIADGYLNAGSDIILANSFTANRCQLERRGLAEKTETSTGNPSKYRFSPLQNLREHQAGRKIAILSDYSSPAAWDLRASSSP